MWSESYGDKFERMKKAKAAKCPHGYAAWERHHCECCELKQRVAHLKRALEQAAKRFLEEAEKVHGKHGVLPSDLVNSWLSATETE